jgi:hypothetical protein
VTVNLDCLPEVDRVELDELTVDLRRRLLELDVGSVEPAGSAEVPAGAKAVEVAAAGALLITLTPLVVRSVVQLLQTWLQHRPVRSIKLVAGDRKLEISAVSSADQARIVDAFIATLGNS